MRLTFDSNHIHLTCLYNFISGTGNLTKHLVSLGAQVTALEKDDTLYERLVESYQGVENLRLIKGDVLRVNVDEILQDMMHQDRGYSSDNNADGGANHPNTLSSSPPSPSSSPLPLAAVGAKAKIKVLSNLPYNITKEFLKLMLSKGDRVSDLSIMIQEEVAQRLVDKRPGRSDYRAMNIRVLFYSRPRYQFIIPKEKYYPAPGVDGALVTFSLLPTEKRPRVTSERSFMSFVAKAFSERRKMIRNSVQPIYSQEEVEGALKASGLRVDSRAQDLTVEDFVTVHNLLGETARALVEGEGEEEEEEDD